MVNYIKKWWVVFPTPKCMLLLFSVLCLVKIDISLQYRIMNKKNILYNKGGNDNFIVKQYE
jgi:hypothetical protein